MLAIMENALQPTQRLFIITKAEPEIKIFFSFLPIGGGSNLRGLSPLQTLLLKDFSLSDFSFFKMVFFCRI